MHDADSEVRVSPGEPAVVAWLDDLLQCLGDLGWRA